jgi:hypothetical protein
LHNNEKKLNKKTIHPKLWKQLSPIQTKSITITTSKLKVLLSFEIVQIEINNPQKYATTQPTISIFSKNKNKNKNEFLVMLKICLN